VREGEFDVIPEREGNLYLLLRESFFQRIGNAGLRRIIRREKIRRVFLLP
jgi:hypothetical protein